MSFWIVTVLLALLSLATLTLALIRGRIGAQPAAAYDLKVYREQMREVDKDLARGVIEEGDADRLRNEIARRILAADAALKAATDETAGAGRGTIIWGGVLAVVMLGGSFYGYSQLGAPGYGDLGLQKRIALAEEAYRSRPSQEVAESALPAPTLPPNVARSHLDLVQRLRDAVAERPNDLEGHALLAQEEARLGQYQAAYAAQQRIIEIKGPAATAQDFALMATMMTLAAGDYVSPEAEVFMREALSRDAQNPLARYHLGLMMMQTGRPDVAFGIWRQLLDAGPADAPWLVPIRARIEDLAWRAGVDYTLPEAPASDLRGPSAEDMEAARDMSSEEQLQMIQGMVSGLSDRLATEGGTPQEWAQLIGALAVLGDTDRARAIYAEAQQVFAQVPDALAIIAGAAQNAGLNE